MKKKLALLLAMMMLFSVGCGKGEKNLLHEQEILTIVISVCAVLFCGVSVVVFQILCKPTFWYEIIISPV